MMASATILPYTFIAIRIPSGTHKVVKIVPDTAITLGKYGTFNTNLLLGRPYYLTYEILEKSSTRSAQELRTVPATELHAETSSEDVPNSAEFRDEGSMEPNGLQQFDSVTHKGEMITRNNRLTVDDSTRQVLTMEEIEELKKADTGSGKDIIAKIMKSHSAIDEKTAFSLAKYTLRKSKKYMKRFTVLPLDVTTLAHWMLMEKEPSRIMEIRGEMLGLISSWSNVHFDGLEACLETSHPKGRFLVVDDTGGLIVAAMAERMAILHPHNKGREDEGIAEVEEDDVVKGISNANTPAVIGLSISVPSDSQSQRLKPKRHPTDAQSAVTNSITLIHPAAQPNLALLSYFSFDPSDTSSRSTAVASSSHPLHTHLKTVSLLQLISPELDGSYEEPESFNDDEINCWKSNQRGNYFRKRRRWERTKRVVDETRAGGFDGLVVASAMRPASVLHRLVPLLRGGAQVCVYSPSVEPLAELADCYSSSRKTAFLNVVARKEDAPPEVPSEDFPLDPRLLLAPSVQTARAREWQVLPGRTHPLMTSIGAAEGYLFTATRVLPADGRVEARGRFSKKRKVALPVEEAQRHPLALQERPVLGTSFSAVVEENND